MPKFINNDTIALVFLGAVALLGVLFKSNDVVAVSIGAIGGYIGAKSNE